jgi:hypothetical protein
MGFFAGKALESPVTSTPSGVDVAVAVAGAVVGAPRILTIISNKQWMHRAPVEISGTGGAHTGLVNTLSIKAVVAFGTRVLHGYSQR